MNCKINYLERDVSKTVVNHCEDQNVVMWAQTVAAAVEYWFGTGKELGCGVSDHLSDHVLMARTDWA